MIGWSNHSTGGPTVTEQSETNVEHPTLRLIQPDESPHRRDETTKTLAAIRHRLAGAG
jgi:hypothetical protein